MANTLFRLFTVLSLVAVSFFVQVKMIDLVFPAKGSQVLILFFALQFVHALSSGLIRGIGQSEKK